MPATLWPESKGHPKTVGVTAPKGKNLYEWVLEKVQEARERQIRSFDPPVERIRGV